MSIIQNNLTKLQTVDFWGMLSKTSFRESNGVVVSYLNLTVHRITGEILEIAPKGSYYKDSLSTPLEIQQKQDLPPPSYLYLRLIQVKGEEWPEEIKRIVDTSLSKFNEQQKATHPHCSEQFLS